MYAEPKKKPWAFLAYIAGDNNLSDYGLEDIAELCKVGSSKSVHAAVQIDTYGEHDGSIRYEISEKDFEETAYRTVIQRLKESDSGNPTVLKNFLNWGFKRYPADKTLLVIWNHGSGFRSVRRDIAYDDFGSSLDMPEITRAFTRAGISEQNKLAILGFDACLMNMIEIGHHLAPLVEVMVGSEQTEPGNGWPYDKVLQAMHENPPPQELGGSIVKMYIDSYKEVGERNVTQSAVKLSKIEPVMTAFSDLGKALVPHATSKRSAIRAARLASQSFESSPDYLDLAHFTVLVANALPQVETQASILKIALDDCLLNADSYGPQVENAKGLSFWFPTGAAQYAEYRTKYLNLRFGSTDRGWVDLLDAYYS